MSACTCTDPAVACTACVRNRDHNGWPKDWRERMRDGWHDSMQPGDDCGGAPDWCLAPNGVECSKHDENGDRRESATDCLGLCGEHHWLDRPESDTRECLVCGTEVD